MTDSNRSTEGMGVGERWEKGIPHDPRSVALYKSIEALDFEQGDYFGFKSGGDGDNGEHLMYLLDMHFARSPDGASGERIPAVLFDGYAVFKALSKDATRRTSTENVSDVLDAVVRLLRGPALDEAGRAAPEPRDEPHEPCNVAVCWNCRGSGQDGDAPDANGEGGWIGKCERCDGEGIINNAPEPDAAGMHIMALRDQVARLSSRSLEPVAKPTGVNKADGCPVCFVPWGACQHTNPPKERT